MLGDKGSQEGKPILSEIRLTLSLTELPTRLHAALHLHFVPSLFFSFPHKVALSFFRFLSDFHINFLSLSQSPRSPINHGFSLLFLYSITLPHLII